MMTETAAGIAILLALSTALLVAMYSQRRGLRRLVEDRQAARLAEHALTQMQMGDAKLDKLDAEITVAPIAKADAPPGHRWVDVSVKYNTGSASLTGLVAESAMPEKGPGQ
jgi:hypothetical protein